MHRPDKWVPGLTRLGRFHIRSVVFVFLLRRPTPADIDRFHDVSRDLPLSYAPVGVLKGPAGDRRFDEQIVSVGHGDADFERACRALVAWKHFDLGWIAVLARPASIDVGTVVAVQIRHLGFWSLNGCRVVYHVEGEGRFGFAYGTLTNHAESGEELFEVFMDARTGDVMYRILAVSWPQDPLARLGQPFVRFLQARFRRDSAAALKRAVRGSNG
jgi:uncharacterized protein (UPF0548 family)